MSDPAAPETVGTDPTVVSSNTLGAPGRCEPLRCSSLAIELLTQMAGPGMALASLSLELAPAMLAAGEEVVIRTKADKRTRMLAFLSLEARSGEAVVFGARGVFSAHGVVSIGGAASDA